MLRSTLSGREFPFERIEEFTEGGESLEVFTDVSTARVNPGRTVRERFAEFLPFALDNDLSLGEGNTPLLPAGGVLSTLTGIGPLLLKNETMNPTWSFKDRGSLTSVAMGKRLGEKVTATISTGNMGHSVAAYAAHAGLRAIVFVPHYAPAEKVRSIALHWATVLRIEAPDYSLMKKELLRLAPEFQLRIVSGNGPIRTEGYKLTSFEMHEQLSGTVPDFIAVPSSACGHVRGLFKGYRELKTAGLTDRLPRMIVVQAENVNPLVSAIKKGLDRVVPVKGRETIAEAITSGDPPGGDEIAAKAREFGWLAEDVTEGEILDGQRRLAEAGYFVEPASAASLHAVRKLRSAGLIRESESVVLMLTGSGLKDLSAAARQPARVMDCGMNDLRGMVEKLLAPGRDFT